MNPKKFNLDMVRYRIGKEKVRWVMVGRKSKNGKMAKLKSALLKTKVSR